MSSHYINGSFVDDAHAVISVSDLGLTRGLGVFDVLRTYNKKPFHLWDHLSRLRFSAREIGIEVPEEFEAMEKIILQLLDSYPEDEACIKTIVTGGVSSQRFSPDRKATLIISAMPLITFPSELYTQGVSVHTVSLERPLPQCKTLFYAPAHRALKEGERFNSIEAIYLNQKNEILEGLTSNFFGFCGDTLITSNDDKILCGITREVALRITEGHFPIERRPIPYNSLCELDEVFITSCTKEILPVTQIDGKLVSNGEVGPRTKRLMDLFSEYAARDSWESLYIERHEGAPVSL